MVFKIIDRVLVPLLVIELKRALGEGGCDPLVQAEYSVLKRWGEEELKVLREKCCCPTLVLAGGGPNLALLGVVWTDRFIVQHITDIFFIAQATTSPDEQIYRLARLFTAIRSSLKELDEYYECINAQPTIPLQPNIPHHRFFPHVTSFLSHETNEVVKFRYISAIDDEDSTNLIFRIETEEEEPCPLIVKFSDRYGYAAHQCLAECGFAPKLFYYGLIDGKTDVLSGGSDAVTGKIRSDAGGLYTGPMHMIVMEYVDGKNAAQIPDTEWPDDAFEMVKAAVDKLHEGGFVFGDLRRPNVMFTRHEHDWRTYLVDFDWSGLEGEVFYPPGLSERPIWAKGVVSFQKIEKEHDLEMLEMHFRHHT
ncbi:hypothetical protein IW261DRAFT_1552020 [Armillaria novae-zelandiae]|uniref:Protein kinase domain-containing protein n=1 Tax=Armillaria novae-zelandiae TaxID=153914 RepID=A0AA39P483_9AGAR|nr:hypothetical protein IW261DRAFT_1552020 [Armillaria novae-zelandiae]